MVLVIYLKLLQKSAERDLPKWLTLENYKRLEEIASLTFDSMIHTDSLKRKIVGLTIERLIRNIQLREINEKNNKFAKKLYMYAAHDFNIATFIRAHNLTSLNTKGPKIPLVPDYGSALIIENLKDEFDNDWINVRIIE